MTAVDDALRTRGVHLEQITLGWNVVGIAVLAWSALAARSIALAAFGLDSLIEIGASTVVLWELRGTGEERRQRAQRLIAVAFIAVAAYVAIQSTVGLALDHRAKHSAAGIAWTAITAVAMFALAAAKTSTGRALRNPVLESEGRVTFVDGLLTTAVLVGLVLNAALDAWWADPAAAYIIVLYALRGARANVR